MRWVKRRWKCAEQDCPRKTFTERIPQVPPRCRITTRLREQAGTEIRDRGITVAGAARHAGVSWPAAHDAFAAAAGPLLEQDLAPVPHLGIDEHRRGRPRWTRDEDTGEYVLLADRWHTCFSGLSGGQGLLGQLEGRTADDAAYWLAQAAPAWRAVRVVAMDMCSIYLSAVRRMLPQAQVAVDLFHVVHLPVKMTGDVRRRVVRGKYRRRGRPGDPEYGIKNLLTRNLEHLTQAQFAKVSGSCRSSGTTDRVGSRATCGVIEFELGWATRSGAELDQLRADRDAGYEWLATHDEDWRRALDVQGALWRGGRMRAVGLPDLLIAAVAERERVTVLHDDGDYDFIAPVTGQPCSGSYLAERFRDLRLGQLTIARSAADE